MFNLRSCSKWLCLIFVVFVLSCSNSIAQQPAYCKVPEKQKFEHVKRTVFVDSKFDSIMVDRIHQAMLEWTQRTRGMVVWDLGIIPTDVDMGEGKDDVCSNSILITAATSDSTVVKKVEELKGEKIAAATYTSCKFNFMLLVTDRLKTVEDFESTTLHELGHFLGLHDVDDKNALMHEDDSGVAKCITASDMEQFCKKWNCDPTSMDVCH